LGALLAIIMCNTQKHDDTLALNVYKKQALMIATFMLPPQNHCYNNAFYKY